MPPWRPILADPPRSRNRPGPRELRRFLVPTATPEIFLSTCRPGSISAVHWLVTAGSGCPRIGPRIVYTAVGHALGPGEICFSGSDHGFTTACIASRQGGLELNLAQLPVKSPRFNGTKPPQGMGSAALLSRPDRPSSNLLVMTVGNKMAMVILPGFLKSRIQRP